MVLVVVEGTVVVGRVLIHSALLGPGHLVLASRQLGMVAMYPPLVDHPQMDREGHHLSGCLHLILTTNRVTNNNNNNNSGVVIVV